MPMHKDRAMDIAHNADALTLSELMEAYAEFHAIVENTPNHFADWSDMIDRARQHPAEDVYVSPDTPIKGKPYSWQRGLHGAIGLVTEAAELLDAHKKELYGKNRPLRPDNIREECGDVFFYLFLMMDAYGIDIRDIIKDNVVKLANRYIEKLEV